MADGARRRQRRRALLLAAARRPGVAARTLPRLVRGALGTAAARRTGTRRWPTPGARWRMEKFSAAFETRAGERARPRATLAGVAARSSAGAATPGGGDAALRLAGRTRHPRASRTTGSGQPWLTVQSLAAIPLTQPFVDRLPDHAHA
ncbi:MAG: hypothetical protein MZV65_37465 [Chromatiales bacterium]|nr:hypothetical protein [Chromatiales bacterium]